MSRKPALPPNANRFIAFRLLFNCRFYYPVYTVLFLDLGVSMGEFALLNAFWAVAIILLEVPSGALADQFGRRRLVVAAGSLMVLEMVLLLVAPIGGVALLFQLLLANRFVSGAAAAAASGADEALAYDSLPRDRKAQDWHVSWLGLPVRWRSVSLPRWSLEGSATMSVSSTPCSGCCRFPFRSRRSG